MKYKQIKIVQFTSTPPSPHTSCSFDDFKKTGWEIKFRRSSLLSMLITNRCEESPQKVCLKNPMQRKWSDTTTKPQLQLRSPSRMTNCGNEVGPSSASWQGHLDGDTLSKLKWSNIKNLHTHLTKRYLNLFLLGQWNVVEHKEGLPDGLSVTTAHWVHHHKCQKRRYMIKVFTSPVNKAIVNTEHRWEWRTADSSDSTTEHSTFLTALKL